MDNMHIALCGPVTVDLLSSELGNPDNLPEKCHPYPLSAYLAKQYLKKGHYVSCITTCPSLFKIRTWQGENLQLIAIPKRKTLHSLMDVYRAEVSGLRKVLCETKPDVIHAQWTYEYADAALSSGFPSLITARDAPWRVVRTMRSLVRLERALYCQFSILPRVRNLCTVSPYMANVLKRQCFYRRDIQVIPNGVCEESIAPMPKKALMNIKAPVICCISEWGNSLKNLTPAIYGFQKLRSDIPGARLILFGVGLGPNEMAEKYCKSNGLRDGLEYLGYCSQDYIRKFLRNDVDIVLHTSLEESFGMTILDGMAQGIPCIGGMGSGAIPWLLDEGRCGILVDIKNPQEIALAIKGLIDTPDTYAQYAQKAHERVLEMFTMEKMAEKYITTLAQIAAH